MLLDHYRGCGRVQVLLADGPVTRPSRTSPPTAGYSVTFPLPSLHPKLIVRNEECHVSTNCSIGPALCVITTTSRQFPGGANEQYDKKELDHWFVLECIAKSFIIARL